MYITRLSMAMSYNEFGSLSIHYLSIPRKFSNNVCNTFFEQQYFINSYFSYAWFHHIRAQLISRNNFPEYITVLY